MLGANMAGGNSSTGRSEDDFYATPESVTKALLIAERDFIPSAIIVGVTEPCAGDGAIAKLLEAEGISVEGFDINPRSYGTHGDFETKKEIAYDYVITNPPFKLAEKLIRICFERWEVTYLALLLKSTFFHADNRKELFEQHKPTRIYALPWRPDFRGLGRPTMECMWVVWDYRDGKTDKCEYLVAPNCNPKHAKTKPKKAGNKPSAN